MKLLSIAICFAAVMCSADDGQKAKNAGLKRLLKSGDVQLVELAKCGSAVDMVDSPREVSAGTAFSGGGVNFDKREAPNKRDAEVIVETVFGSIINVDKLNHGVDNFVLNALADGLTETEMVQFIGGKQDELSRMSSLTNVQKSKHDAAMAAIQNTR